MAYDGPSPIPVIRGGTGDSTITGVLTGNGTSAVTASAVTQYDVLVGAASNAISSVAPSATSGVPLISQGNAANPAFGTVVVAGGGTGATTLTGVLTGNGTSAVTASAVTQYDVLVGGASNAVSSVGPGTSGQILQSGGNAANPAYSTSTYPATNAANTILYASSANTMAALATANNGVLITSASGVPSILADGTTGQILTATTGAPPSWAAASSAGAWVALQSQTASNSASIAFNSTYITATYNIYIIVMNGIQPVTNSVTFYMQVSTDNGSTYLSAGYASLFTDMISSVGGITSTSEFILSYTSDVSNSANGPYSATYYLYNMTNGGRPQISGTSTYDSTVNSAAISGVAGGYGPATTTVNNIKFLFTSGNISTGTFTLFGLTL